MPIDQSSKRLSGLAVAYPWYVVVVLMLALVCSFLDRMVINLLVDPIRRDMHLTDTQVSLLMGFSFAVFYTLFGLPLARIADSTNRRNMISWAIVLWSLMTALCGTVKGYTQFLLARMGVGVGEAALSPAAYSLIADYFPPRKLATALGVYHMGIALGSGVALLLGALALKLAALREVWTLPVVGEIFPWQMVFLIVGIPGLAIALLVLTIREPLRQIKRDLSAVKDEGVLAFIRGNARTLLCHNLGFASISLATYALSAWVPTTLVRVHGMTMVQAAVTLGSMLTVCGVLGAWIGGGLADRFANAGHGDARVKVGRFAALGMLPFVVGFGFANSLPFAIAMLAPCLLLASATWGPAAAALQEIAPPHLRARVSALYLFVTTLVGLGLGPTLVALVTDYGFGNDRAVGNSLGMVGGGACILALGVFRLGRKPTRSQWTPGLSETVQIKSVQ